MPQLLELLRYGFHCPSRLGVGSPAPERVGLDGNTEQSRIGTDSINERALGRCDVVAVTGRRATCGVQQECSVADCAGERKLVCSPAGQLPDPHHLGAAALQNAAGNFEYPNIAPIEAAATVVKSVPANNEMHIVDPPKSDKLAYPLSTFTYCIVPKGAAQKAGLASWIYYAMTLGQSFGAALDFAPIPRVVLNAGVKSVRELAAS